ncbi:MAG: sulfatase-like hydrolase/transferase, partial [Chloroflexi bacterium]|nr:sulfatase-like hydrolase/transferase [Chloroflexota bacterium]
MNDTRKRPNVLLLGIDALRPDRLHCYGNTWETSPAIDRIASEGVLFEQMIAHSSHTLPSMGSVLTGLDPMQHGMTNPRTHASHGWGDWIPPLKVMEQHGMIVGGFNAFLYNHFGNEPNIANVEEARPFFEEERDNPFFLWQFLEQAHLPYNPPPPYNTAFLPVDHVISEDTARRLEIVKSTMIVHPSGRISQFEQDQAEGNTGGFEAD